MAGITKSRCTKTYSAIGYYCAPGAGKRHRGNAKISLVPSYQDGLCQVGRIERIRTRHGYRPVS